MDQNIDKSLSDDTCEVTTELYKNMRALKGDVHNTISIFRKYIRNSYNPYLLKGLENILKDEISDKAYKAMQKFLKNNCDPFENYETEKKRLSVYKEKGLYCEPEKINIGENKIYLEKEDDLTEATLKKTTLIHMPLERSLTRLFEIEGLYDATISNINALIERKKENPSITEHVIQTSKWQKLVQNFEKKDGDIFPLLISQDDFNPGNELGSRGSNNEIGVTYVTSPVLPDSFGAKLKSILPSDIFFAKDRKEFGNAATFKRLIKDLNSLRENGVIITLNKGTPEQRKKKIYFIAYIFVFDNKGANSTCGFTEGFGKGKFCRICYVDEESFKTLIQEDISLLRNVDQYEKDVENLNVRETGIKEKCVFNEIVGVHVLNNVTVDEMHDIREGSGNYAMADIVHHLIQVEKAFTLKYLNDKLTEMSFGYEKGNVPPPISLEYVKKNGRLKMSASESTFFIRYFGAMVGDQVDPHSEVWLLYLKLRQIIDIVTSPMFSESDLETLETTIVEFNKLYINLFGDLKPKFHFALHYVRMMRRDGPVCKLSTMRFESKHRELKMIIISTFCHINILYTIASRYELALMHFSYYKYTSFDVTYGSSAFDTSMYYLFPEAKDKECVSYVIVNNHQYSPGTIIIVDINDDGIKFGKILNVYRISEKVHFKYTPLYMIGQDKRYFGYSVEENEEKKELIEFENLADKTPCLMFKIQGRQYVFTRYQP